MSTAAAQLRFAAEFAAFLVSGAGLSLALLRPDLLVRGRQRRAVLLAGFVAIGVSAFVRGSLVVDEGDVPLLTVRLAGIGLVALGATGWRGGTRWLPVLAGGLGLVAVGAVLALAASDDTWSARVADALTAAGAAAIGAALFGAGRRSVAARVATTATATLLLVVVAVSVALSAVISSNVEDEAIRRAEARAATVKRLVENEQTNVLISARLLAAAPQGNPGRAAELRRLADAPRPSPSVQADLQTLSDSLYASGPLLYVTARGAVVAAVGTAPGQEVALAGSRVVTEALAQSGERSAVQVIGEPPAAFSVAAVPVVVGLPEGGTRLVGAAVATTRLDRTWLLQRAGDEVLALVARGRVMAATAGTVGRADVVGGEALISGKGASTFSDDRLLVAQPVLLPDGTPELTVVVSQSRAPINETRESLFRNLFVVALGTALAGLLLSAVVGARIGRGLRALTGAAESIQAGDLAVRAGVDSDDEVGVLSAAFDSMAGSIQEMTQELRVAAEDEAELRNRLEAIVAGMGEALVAVDAAGTVIAFNRAAEELTGIDASQAMGRAVASALHALADDRGDLVGKLAEPPDRPWSETGFVVHTDGSEVPVAVSAGGVRGVDGELAGAVFVLRDMRREREVERMKTEFLANISHELRTPLTPIKGYAEVLRARSVPRAQADGFLSEILESASRLERTIDLLINFAAIEAGRLTLLAEPVDVRKLVDETIRRWSDRVDERHPLRRRVSRQVPRLTADRHLLERSLDELIDNAVKYSPEGGTIAVSAELAPNNGSGQVVTISVSDRGVGISPDQVDAVVNEFSQADASATRRFGGLGLGLAFVQRIARAHDGELVFESEPGRGSTFSIVLPVSGADS